MQDFFDELGEKLAGWTGQPLGNRMTGYSIYEKSGSYTAVGQIGNGFYRQPFDHLPSPEEVEKHFATDERFKEHFRT
jgi:hypothetical protein